jgi:hypothetical protein
VRSYVLCCLNGRVFNWDLCNNDCSMVLFLVLEQWFIFSSYFQFGMCLMDSLVACFVPILCLVVWLHKMWNIAARTALFCLDMLGYFVSIRNGIWVCSMCILDLPWIWCLVILQSVPAILVLCACPCLLFISYNYFCCRCIMYLLFFGFFLLALSSYHMRRASCIHTSASSLPGW